MPFVEVSVKDRIEAEKAKSPEFAQAWEDSRMEYKLLSEMVKLRKEQKLTQSDLAQLTGNKQQVISRIEQRENSPTLKTFCGLLNTLGYDLQIVKRTQE